jgi:hypothetical protein
MFPLTHLSFKKNSYGTAFDVIFVDSPIFNRYIVHGITNMSQWKYSITATVVSLSAPSQRYSMIKEEEACQL